MFIKCWYCKLLRFSKLHIYIKLATSKNIDRKSMFQTAIYYIVKNVRGMRCMRYNDRGMRTTFKKIESRSSTMENITETCCRIRDKGLWRANTGCLENH